MGYELELGVGALVGFHVEGVNLFIYFFNFWFGSEFVFLWFLFKTYLDLNSYDF